MMEKEYIQKLLDSYMAAETTKEEEQLLSEYFSTHRDIPAEWREFSILFRGIRQYEQKPYVSYRRIIIKWSAAAAMIAFVFGIGLSLQHQEETCKPSHVIAQTKDVPTPVAIEPHLETIAEVTPTVAEITAKPSRSVRTGKSAKQKSRDVQQMKPAKSKQAKHSTVKSNDARPIEVVRANIHPLDEVMAAANIMGEQVETYHIQPAGDATIVTKTFVDGTSSSCLVCAMDGGSGYSVIPL